MSTIRVNTILDAAGGNTAAINGITPSVAMKPLLEAGDAATARSAIGAGTNTLNVGTAVATTSGTAIDFTGLPSGVSRVTFALSGVSTNGNAQVFLRIGTGGVVDVTGYSGSVDGWQSSPSAALYAGSAFTLDRNNMAASTVRHGVGTLLRVSGNTWVMSYNNALSNTAQVGISSGSKTLSGALGIIRLTSSAPDAFDAGTFNITWE